MTTDRFGFSTLGPGDSPDENGFQFTDADRRHMDRLLYYAVERHRHTGETAEDNTPAAGPSLELVPGDGYLPAGVRCFYRYTLVDEFGFETASSPIAYIDTPSAVNEPEAAVAAYASTGGSLLPGQYAFIVTAYKGPSTIETKGTRAASVLVPTTTGTNVITLSLPSLPSGADGFNIYCRGPNSPQYFYLDSTSADSYEHDGAVSVDVARALPKENTTNAQNAVTVSLPGATPTLPDGFHWKLYRTFYATNWSNTLLEEIVEQGATPAIPSSWDDVGQGTSVGSPPTQSQYVGSPPKINLTDSEEIQGYLPPGRNVIPTVVTITFPGPVEVQEGENTWVCEFTQADIVGVRPFLGVNSTPAVDDVIVDVNVSRDGGVTWDTVYTTQANRPRVAVGDQLGNRTTPDIIHLELGDELSFDIDQEGGGATPTDANLSIDVLMLVQAGSTTESWTWGTA